MSRWLVLDLDGTLVDSVPGLTASLNRVMGGRGFTPYSREEVTPMVGDGLAVLLTRAFAARSALPDEHAQNELLGDYIANASEHSCPYPGVHETLRELQAQGWTMAICTNKPEAPAHALLRALELDHFFATVGGGDTYPIRKPDPGHLLAILHACGGQPARAIMVGDHHNDIEAAIGAGVASVWARWGYGNDVPGATAGASQFTELPAIVNRLVPA